MIVTLPRRRAIQGSKKINPVDQPGSCPVHLEIARLAACA